RSNPLGLLDQCHGDVVPLRLGKTAWLVLNPADTEHILEHSETRYTKGRAFRFGRQLYGNSLLVSEGEEHRRQVRQIGRLFFQHAAKSFLQPAVDITKRWMERWKLGEPFDLWSSLLELTLAISSRALFGQDFLPGWLTNQNDQQSRQILNAYDEAMDHVARQNFSLLPLPDWIPSAGNRRYKQAIRTLNTALQSSVEKRLSGEASGGFLDVLLNVHRKTPALLSENEVRDQALVLLLGGYESTATALCWTILLLAVHDPIRQQLQEEIQRVVNTDVPHSNHIPQLRYTGQVFSESVRLYPPPWLIPRTSICDETLPSGHRIRSNSQVFLSPYCLQRNPRLFENPLRFDPNRFASNGQHAFPSGCYFPFGAGPRHCLGESIARSQAALIIATLFRCHYFHLPSKELPPANPLLTLRPTFPIPVQLKRANDESENDFNPMTY
ncbi:MAG: cytochrome P450, partial [Planctomycetaceae bacterium]|nr:cytochrome P450 [Planctomycetaceae bacterium]